MKRLCKNALSSHTGVTIKDVAAGARVSTATVSRVLSGVNPVSDEVRSRVMKVIKHLNYQPNRLAQGLRAGQRRIIGVIIPDLQNPFFTSLIHGVEDALYKAGYTLLLGHSDGLVERELTHISVLRGEGAAGLIFAPTNEEGADYSSLAQWNIPVVAVDRLPRGLKVDLAGTDSRKGVRDAVHHLIEHGYRTIGFINGPQGLDVAENRFAGYRDGLREAGIDLNSSLIIRSDFRQAGGFEAMMRLLDLPKPPRAMLIANNLMTLGALQAIHERGVRIPNDIAVISFDDMSWASSLRPPLTAIAQPAEELGHATAQLLLDRIQNPERAPRRILLPVRMVLRDSCGRHPVPVGK